MKVTHKICMDVRCGICMKEHLELGYELERCTGIDTVDHLGRFHKWLGDNGIEPETEWGWGSDAYFDEENINAYIEEWSDSTTDAG